MVQSLERPAEPRPAPVREALTMKSLLEAGVHFGHQTRRWNPRMRRYIFTQRNGIHIIDLQQTLGMINEAYRSMTQLVADGGKLLFVGTKRQAQEVVQSEAERCGMWYVNQRWLGGTLTNFQTIRSRINYMLELQQKRDQGYFRVLPKKEAVKLRDTLNRLEKYFLGMREMSELPAALFVIDIGKEDICIAEARRMGVQIFAIIDTDCDPEKVDHAIPGNDDAVRSIRLITTRMATAVMEGLAQREALLEAEREATLEAEREELALAGHAVEADLEGLEEELLLASLGEEGEALFPGVELETNEEPALLGAGGPDEDSAASTPLAVEPVAVESVAVEPVAVEPVAGEEAVPAEGGSNADDPPSGALEEEAGDPEPNST